MSKPSVPPPSSISEETSDLYDDLLTFRESRESPSTSAESDEKKTELAVLQKNEEDNQLPSPLRSVSEESVDIYSGLFENFMSPNKRRKGAEIHYIYQQCLAAASSLEVQNQQLALEVSALREENDRLKKNISALYKTARAEIGRKDKAIHRLRSELWRERNQPKPSGTPWNNNNLPPNTFQQPPANYSCQSMVADNQSRSNGAVPCHGAEVQPICNAGQATAGAPLPVHDTLMPAPAAVPVDQGSLFSAPLPVQNNPSNNLVPVHASEGGLDISERLPSTKRSSTVQRTLDKAKEIRSKYRERDRRLSAREGSVKPSTKSQSKRWESSRKSSGSRSRERESRFSDSDHKKVRSFSKRTRSDDRNSCDDRGSKRSRHDSCSECDYYSSRRSRERLRSDDRRKSHSSSDHKKRTSKRDDDCDYKDCKDCLRERDFRRRRDESQRSHERRLEREQEASRSRKSSSRERRSESREKSLRISRKQSSERQSSSDRNKNYSVKKSSPESSRSSSGNQSECHSKDFVSPAKRENAKEENRTKMSNSEYARPMDPKDLKLSCSDKCISEKSAEISPASDGIPGDEQTCVAVNTALNELGEGGKIAFENDNSGVDSVSENVTQNVHSTTGKLMAEAVSESEKLSSKGDKVISLKSKHHQVSQSVIANEEISEFASDVPSKEKGKTKNKISGFEATGQHTIESSKIDCLKVGANKSEPKGIKSKKQMSRSNFKTSSDDVEQNVMESNALRLQSPRVTPKSSSKEKIDPTVSDESKRKSTKQHKNSAELSPEKSKEKLTVAHIANEKVVSLSQQKVAKGRSDSTNSKLSIKSVNSKDKKTESLVAKSSTQNISTSVEKLNKPVARFSRSIEKLKPSGIEGRMNENLSPNQQSPKNKSTVKKNVERVQSPKITSTKVVKNDVCASASSIKKKSASPQKKPLRPVAENTLDRLFSEHDEIQLMDVSDVAKSKPVVPICDNAMELPGTNSPIKSKKSGFGSMSQALKFSVEDAEPRAADSNIFNSRTKISDFDQTDNGPNDTTGHAQVGSTLRENIQHSQVSAQMEENASQGSADSSDVACSFVEDHDVDASGSQQGESDVSSEHESSGSECEETDEEDASDEAEEEEMNSKDEASVLEGEESSDDGEVDSEEEREVLEVENDVSEDEVSESEEVETDKEIEENEEPDDSNDEAVADETSEFEEVVESEEELVESEEENEESEEEQLEEDLAMSDDDDVHGEEVLCESKEGDTDRNDENGKLYSGAKSRNFEEIADGSKGEAAKSDSSEYSEEEVEVSDVGEQEPVEKEENSADADHSAEECESSDEEGSVDDSGDAEACFSEESAAERSDSECEQSEDEIIYTDGSDVEKEAEVENEEFETEEIGIEYETECEENENEKEEEEENQEEDFEEDNEEHVENGKEEIQNESQDLEDESDSAADESEEELLENMKEDFDEHSENPKECDRVVMQGEDVVSEEDEGMENEEVVEEKEEELESNESESEEGEECLDYEEHENAHTCKALIEEIFGGSEEEYESEDSGANSDDGELRQEQGEGFEESNDIHEKDCEVEEDEDLQSEVEEDSGGNGCISRGSDNEEQSCEDKEISQQASGIDDNLQSVNGHCEEVESDVNSTKEEAYTDEEQIEEVLRLDQEMEMLDSLKKQLQLEMKMLDMESEDSHGVTENSQVTEDAVGAEDGSLAAEEEERKEEDATFEEGELTDDDDDENELMPRPLEMQRSEPKDLPKRKPVHERLGVRPVVSRKRVRSPELAHEKLPKRSRHQSPKGVKVRDMGSAAKDLKRPKEDIGKKRSSEKLKSTAVVRERSHEKRKPSLDRRVIDRNSDRKLPSTSKSSRHWSVERDRRRSPGRERRLQDEHRRSPRRERRRSPYDERRRSSERYRRRSSERCCDRRRSSHRSRSPEPSSRSRHDYRSSHRDGHRHYEYDCCSRSCRQSDRDRSSRYERRSRSRDHHRNYPRSRTKSCGSSCSFSPSRSRSPDHRYRSKDEKRKSRSRTPRSSACSKQDKGSRSDRHLSRDKSTKENSSKSRDRSSSLNSDRGYVDKRKESRSKERFKTESIDEEKTIPDESFLEQIDEVTLETEVFMDKVVEMKSPEIDLHFSDEKPTANVKRNPVKKGKDGTQKSAQKTSVKHLKKPVVVESGMDTCINKQTEISFAKSTLPKKTAVLVKSKSGSKIGEKLGTKKIKSPLEKAKGKKKVLSSRTSPESKKEKTAQEKNSEVMECSNVDLVESQSNESQTSESCSYGQRTECQEKTRRVVKKKSSKSPAVSKANLVSPTVNVPHAVSSLSISKSASPVISKSSSSVKASSAPSFIKPKSSSSSPAVSNSSNSKSELHLKSKPSSVAQKSASPVSIKSKSKSPAILKSKSATDLKLKTTSTKSSPASSAVKKSNSTSSPAVMKLTPASPALTKSNSASPVIKKSSSSSPAIVKSNTDSAAQLKSNSASPATSGSASPSKVLPKKLKEKKIDKKASKSGSKESLSSSYASLPTEMSESPIPKTLGKGVKSTTHKLISSSPVMVLNKNEVRAGQNDANNLLQVKKQKREVKKVRSGPSTPVSTDESPMEVLESEAASRSKSDIVVTSRSSIENKLDKPSKVQKSSKSKVRHQSLNKTPVDSPALDNEQTKIKETGGKLVKVKHAKVVKSKSDPALTTLTKVSKEEVGVKGIKTKSSKTPSVLKSTAVQKDEKAAKTSASLVSKQKSAEKTVVKAKMLETSISDTSLAQVKITKSEVVQKSGGNQSSISDSKPQKVVKKSAKSPSTSPQILSKSHRKPAKSPNLSKGSKTKSSKKVQK